MINAKMALSLGAKKLKEFLTKKNFKFKFSIEEANKWLSENGHEDLKLSYDSNTDELVVSLKK